jgi:MFS family permease
MLADSVDEKNRGKAFGFHRAMDTLGAIVGPAGAAVLVSLADVRSVFLWAVIPGVLAAAAIAFFTKGSDTVKEPPIPFWRSVRELPSRFRVFLGAVFLFGMGDFARSLLILRATELLTPTLGTTRAAATAMALYVLHNIVYSALSFPIGWLADRFDPQRLLAIGYAFGVATAIGAALTGPSLLALGLLFSAGGITLAFEDTLEGVITSLEVPKSIRGTGFGVLASTNGVGDLISSSLVGALWAAVGPLAAFSAAAVLCLAGTVLLTASGRARTGAEQAALAARGTQA